MTIPREWADDGALPGYESITLPLPSEDDGVLCGTLVRRKHDASSLDESSHTRRAVLYVHGFVDYFFQTHMADAFAAAGWDFYALELRRYGRSLRGGNRPNYCTDLAEYDAELSAAIDIVREEDGHDTLALVGHSTGGLITSWYMHRGARRAQVQALVLNSPFLDFNVPGPRRWTLPIARVVGALLPTLADPNALSRWYGESLLQEHHGEWTYDLRWKPLLGFPAYFGWVRAVLAVQDRVASGLSIESPVLLMHAGSSAWPKGVWREEYLANDIVLNVAHMKARGPRLGTDVTLHAFAGGIHDLVLSKQPVRGLVLASLVEWLNARCSSSASADRGAHPYVAATYQIDQPGTHGGARHA